MTKPDFNRIFEYDSATEEHRLEVVRSYRAAARSAIETAGELVLVIAEKNPCVDIEWSFTPMQERHNRV